MFNTIIDRSHLRMFFLGNKRKNVAININKIGKYNLVKLHSKNQKFGKYSVGIYSYKSKRFFVKSYFGKNTDFDYLNLENEALANTELNKALKALRRNGYVKLPKLIETIKDRNSISIVLELINGVTISRTNKVIQEETLTAVLKTLTKVKPANGKQHLRTLDSSSMLLALPYLLILSIACNPKELVLFCKAFINCLKTFSPFTKKDIRIAHRDIKAENIILSSNQIYLIDLEQMVYTHKAYDICQIALDNNFKELLPNISKKTGLKMNEFVSNYILFSKSISTSNPNNRYINLMRNKYA